MTTHTKEHPMRKLPKDCPDICPKCAADLKEQGYPFAHQHEADGSLCPFEWEPDSNILD